MTIWPSRPGHVRKPDLVFARRGRLAVGKPPAGRMTVVPDLVVEVVSPGDEIEAFEQKLDEYREAGIPPTWRIYPGTRRAHVPGANRPRTEVAPGGVLDGEDGLPGFTCHLAELISAAARAGAQAPHDARVDRERDPAAGGVRAPARRRRAGPPVQGQGAGQRDGVLVDVGV